MEYLAVDVHVTRNSWISIAPPCTSQPRLPLEEAELIETEDLLEAATQCYARLASTDNQDGVIGI